jgi:hypothetical protein
VRIISRKIRYVFILAVQEENISIFLHFCQFVASTTRGLEMGGIADTDNLIVTAPL